MGYLWSLPPLIFASCDNFAAFRWIFSRTYTIRKHFLLLGKGLETISAEMYLLYRTYLYNFKNNTGK